MRKWTSAAVPRGAGGRGARCRAGHDRAHRGDVRIDGANGINLTDEQGITITAPAVGERTLRRYLEATGDWVGAGIADIATDFLTADQSTMMSTPVTFLSASVTVPEQGDTVIVSVSGRWAWMGAGLFVLDDTSNQTRFGRARWRWCAARTPCRAASETRSGITTSRWNALRLGLQTAVPTRFGRARWRWCARGRPARAASVSRSGITTSRRNALRRGLRPIPTRFGRARWRCRAPRPPCRVGFGYLVQGITLSAGGMLYVADFSHIPSVWTCTLALSCTEASLPSRLR